MRRFQRGAAPQVLVDNWQAWGIAWEALHDAGGKFHWHEVDGQPVNHIILPSLRNQTQNHCSFCDAFPVDPPSVPTIEHFRPKAEFEREAYHWPNLYFCCTFCQVKEGDFNEDLLRPDAEDFDFDRYFRWDFTTGMLEINDLASDLDQHRADATRTYFRFNDSHPGLRMRAARKRPADAGNPLPEDEPYRHYV